MLPHDEAFHIEIGDQAGRRELEELEAFGDLLNGRPVADRRENRPGFSRNDGSPDPGCEMRTHHEPDGRVRENPGEFGREYANELARRRRVGV